MSRCGEQAIWGLQRSVPRSRFPGYSCPVSSRHRRTRTVRTPRRSRRLDSETGVLATTDVDAALAGCDAVAYMASGDIRPDDAVTDIERCLRAGRHVVTPSLYSLYDPRSAPPEWVERLTGAAEEGGATLLVSGVDPGWGNDALAVIAAGLCTRIRSIHCQEIFDYSTYDQPYAVKVLVRIRTAHGPRRPGPDDAVAVHPDHGVGRQHPAHRTGSGAGDRRDHRGGRAAPVEPNRSTPSWGVSRKAPRARSGSR